MKADRPSLAWIMAWLAQVAMLVAPFASQAQAAAESKTITACSTDEGCCCSPDAGERGIPPCDEHSSNPASPACPCAPKNAPKPNQDARPITVVAAVAPRLKVQAAESNERSTTQVARVRSAAAQVHAREACLCLRSARVHRPPVRAMTCVIQT